ncbi:Divalent-cation tolerance protein CutA [uncultured archaeon]|nr:Divalent-cation tolerance protein CutA [uncultured archaeon]
MRYLLVVTSVASKKDARRLARLLVCERLSSCVNILPAESVYKWGPKIAEEKEYVLLCKTESARYKKIEELLLNEHPYALPAIYALPVEKGSKNYLKWVSTQLRKKTSEESVYPPSYLQE